MNQDSNMNQNNFNNGYNQPMNNNIPGQNMNYGQPTQGAPMPGATPAPGPMPMQGAAMPGPMPAPGPMPMQGAAMPGPMPMPGQQPAMQQNQNPYQMPGQQYNGFNQAQQNKKLNPIIIAVPIVIIVAIVGLLLITGGSGYKKPIENYCNGLNDLDINTINKALPEEMINDMGTDLADELKFMKDTLTSVNATFSVKCDISSDKVELTSDELKELSDDFKSDYNSTRDITKAYYVKVARTTSVQYKGGTPNEETENVTVTVGKIDGKWYYIDEK